jgi:hypothetical protein
MEIPTIKRPSSRIDGQGHWIELQQVCHRRIAFLHFAVATVGRTLGSCRSVPLTAVDGSLRDNASMFPEHASSTNSQLGSV